MQGVLSVGSFVKVKRGRTTGRIAIGQVTQMLYEKDEEVAGIRALKRFSSADREDKFPRRARKALRIPTCMVRLVGGGYVQSDRGDVEPLLDFPIAPWPQPPGRPGRTLLDPCMIGNCEIR